MKPAPLHGLAAALALHGGAAAVEAEAQAEPPARSQGRRRPLSTTPEAIRQRRAQARKRAARRAAAKAGSVISSVIDHAQDHAADHAPRVVDLDLELLEKSSKGTSRDRPTSEITLPRDQVDPSRLDRRRLYAGFELLLREAGLEYPQPAPFLEQKAAREILAEHHVADALRAAKQLVREWRRGDEWTREHRPATLAYLRHHVVELLHRAPRPPPARPRPQLELDEQHQEGPQPRILPGPAPRVQAEPRAAREVVQAELAKLRERGLA